MKKTFKGLFPIVITLFVAFHSFAQPLRSVDITWDQIGKDSFLVHANIYTDCQLIGLGSYIDLDVHCKKTGTKIMQLSLNNSGVTDATPDCKYNTCDPCSGASCSFDYGYNHYTFRGLLDLNGKTSCCEIILSYKAYFRNGIPTVTGNQWYYTESVLNRCVQGGNSSPKFMNQPPLIICKSEQYFGNAGVYDNDSSANGTPTDSFVFEITSPLKEHNTPISYTGSYSYDKPLSFWGFPVNGPYPKGFHLDTFSGDLKFYPMQKEMAIIAYKIKEYRNGQLIGEVTRDMVLTIIDCAQNKTPIIQAHAYKEVCLGDTVKFDIVTRDETGDTVMLFLNDTFAGLNWSSTSGTVQYPTATLSWVPEEKHVRENPYIFTVTAKDQHCPLNGWKTMALRVKVKESPKAWISDKSLGCGAYEFVAVKEDSSRTENEWYYEGSLKSKNDSLLISFIKPGQQTLDLKLIHDNGCTNTISYKMMTDSFLYLDIGADTLICSGKVLNINADTQNIKGKYDIRWSTGDSNQFSFNTAPLYKDTFFAVRITDESGCVVEDTLNVTVDNFKVNVTFDTVCYGDKALAVVHPVFDEGLQMNKVSWYDFGCGCYKGGNDSVFLFTKKPYLCIAKNNNGCVATDTFKIKFIEPPVLSVNIADVLCKNDPDIDLNKVATPKGGQWFADKGLINNDSFKISELDLGYYQLEYYYVDSLTGCSNSHFVFTEIKDYPTVFAGPDDTACSNANKYALLGAPKNPYGLWYGKGVAGKKGEQFVKLNPDSVKNGEVISLVYKYTNHDGCSNTDTMALTVFTPRDWDQEPPVEICENAAPLKLTDYMNSGNWSGTAVAANIFNPTVAGDGDYLLHVDYENDICLFEDSFSITVWPAPDSSIQLMNDTFYVTKDQSAYEWYLDNQMISGANSYFYVGKMSGYYFARLTNQYGCSATTAKLYYNSISHTELSGQISIYPNPLASGVLHVKNQSHKNLESLQVIDLHGKLVKEVKVTTGIRDVEVQLDDLNSGAYLIRMQLNDVVVLKAVIIQK